MTKPHPFRALLLLALSILTSGAALPAHAYSALCNKEIRLHCAEVVLGEGRLTACAIKQREHLSTTCKTEVQAATEVRAGFLNACRSDGKLLCPRITPGHGRLYACLKFNEEQLAAACKQQLE